MAARRAITGSICVRARDYLAVDAQGHAEGDNRINPFGVGSEAAVRAGLLYQKVTVTGPTLHFGLGDNPQADAVRLLWTNGASQAEFQPDLKTNARLSRLAAHRSAPPVPGCSPGTANR